MLNFFMLFSDVDGPEVQEIRALFRESGYQKAVLEFDLARRAFAVYAAGAEPPYVLLSHPKLRAYHQGSPLDVGYLRHHFGEKFSRVALAYNEEFLAALQAKLKLA